MSLLSYLWDLEKQRRGEGSFKVIMWGGVIFIGGVDSSKHHELKDLTIDKEAH